MGLGGCPLVRRRPASLWKSIMPGLTLKTQLFLIFMGRVVFTCGQSS